MRGLGFHLDRLCAWLALACPDLHWRRIALVDAGRTHCDGTRLRVPRIALASPDEFASRFAEYLHSGYAWIHLAAEGVVSGILVVLVYVPAQACGTPPAATSVNLAGPGKGIQVELVSDSPA
jgi:hypothetical protein